MNGLCSAFSSLRRVFFGLCVAASAWQVLLRGASSSSIQRAATFKVSSFKTDSTKTSPSLRSSILLFCVGAMSASPRARRCVVGVGGSAASKRRLSPAATAETGPAGSRCLDALIVAINQASDVQQWYTATKELQLASLSLCEACRSTHTVQLTVDRDTPTTLLAEVHARRSKPEKDVFSRVPRVRARRVRWQLFPLDLLSNQMDTWAEVEELFFAQAFGGSLGVRAWPSRLRVIEFGWSSFFNKPIEGVVWPPSLQLLEFGDAFNQPIEDVTWPTSLKQLRFGISFNQPIEGVAWPPSLQLLEFDDAFDQPIEGVTWPSSLQQLILGFSFNQAIERVQWPRSLQELSFSYGFNRPIEGVAWPASLQLLEFGHSFNQPIKGVTWPASLQRLRFGDLFNQLIDGVTWPTSLQHLVFGMNFDQSLELMPSLLRRLTVGKYFRQSLNKLGAVMPSLERLGLRLRAPPAELGLACGIQWPTGLKHLDVRAGADLEGIALPPSVSVVYHEGPYDGLWWGGRVEE